MAVESGEYTPETVATRQRIADQLLMQAAKPREIRSKLQGMGQLGEGLIAGLMVRGADQEQKEGNSAAAEWMATALRGGNAGPPPAAAGSSPVAAPVADAARPPTTLVGDNPPIAPVRVASMSPEAGITAPPRAVVPSSAKVIGDDEGVRLGLYDPPKAPGMAPPTPSPSFGDRFAAANGSIPPASPVNNVAAALNPAAGGPPVTAPPPAPVQVAQNAPAAIPGASPLAEKIAAVLSDKTASPYVRKQAMALGQQLLVKQLEGDKPTDEMREYGLYQKQGGKDSFFDYKSGLKKAGAQNINVGVSGDKSFATHAAEGQAKRYNELAAEAPKAKQMLADVEVLTDLGKNIGTGKLAQVKESIGPYADALGIDIKGLSEIQAFEKVVNRVAPNLRVPGSGAQSDFELRSFLKQLPSLGDTPEGNAIGSAVMQGLYQNKVEAAKIASLALNEKITRPEAEAKLQDLPDPLVPYREFMKKSRADVGGASAPQIDPAALAEAKRRGLVK